MTRRIYRFSKASSDWKLGEDNDGHSPKSIKNVLGGKGASLVEMCSAGLNVPPGFTITTEVCNAYRMIKDDPELTEAFMDDLMQEVSNNMYWLDNTFGYLPLVSVRSGAPVSMPGMMDTILNVCLTSNNLHDWRERIGNRPALDSQRRLIQMLGHTAYDIPDEAFNKVLDDVKKAAFVKEDADLNALALNDIVDGYKLVFLDATDEEFPDFWQKQLRAAIRAVFDSWMNPRAVEYRRLNGISENMGTAVTVQAMVFGNMGSDSGSGVLFTRNPSTGEQKIMGEYLENAQGEDVVAGIRTPKSLAQVAEEAYATEAQELPDWLHQVMEVCVDLEKHYRDMVDLEFTVQKGELFVLQSRVGKRSARAAFKIAYDMATDDFAKVKITADEALSRLTPEQFKVVSRPGIDPAFKEPADLTGLPACPGIAVGIPVFSSADAVNCKEPCILVTHETTPDDIAGMAKAAGILTQTGGATSHAAVVARAMDKPCVVGCTQLDLSQLSAGAADMAKTGDKLTLTLDGATGRAWLATEVPVVDASDSPEVREVMSWCMERMGAVELHSVNPEVEPGEAPRYRLSLLETWGDQDLLDIALDELCERDCSGIVLDLTSPEEACPAADTMLRDCFSVSVVDKDDFRWVVAASVQSRGDKLKGLTILNDGLNKSTRALLTKRGIQFVTHVSTMSDLLDGLGTPTPGMVSSVIGGEATWARLRDLLENSGVKFASVPPAVPAQHATFAVLGGGR